MFYNCRCRPFLVFVVPVTVRILLLAAVAVSVVVVVEAAVLLVAVAIALELVVVVIVVVDVVVKAAEVVVDVIVVATEKSNRARRFCSARAVNAVHLGLPVQGGICVATGFLGSCVFGGGPVTGRVHALALGFEELCELAAAGTLPGASPEMVSWARLCLAVAVACHGPAWLQTRQKHQDELAPQRCRRSRPGLL